jgi:hypothetical protein
VTSWRARIAFPGSWIVGARGYRDDERGGIDVEIPFATIEAVLSDNANVWAWQTLI